MQTVKDLYNKIFGYLNPLCTKIPYGDKGCHFIAGFVITFVVSLFLDIVVGFLMGALIAAIKETIDYSKGGKWDYIDFFATIFGSLVAIFPLWLLWLAIF